MTIPCYINNFNRLTTTKNMCLYLENIPGIEIIILDNASSFDPLLEWYEECPYAVELLDHNGGSHSPWDSGAIEKDARRFKKMWGQDYYIITDSDLDLSNIPNDFISVFLEGFSLRGNIVKVGFSLEYEDIPIQYKQHVNAYEDQYWKTHILGERCKYWEALIDTTFAMIPSKWDHAYVCSFQYPQYRTGSPYIAKHVPWYVTAENLTYEEWYYFKHCNHSVSYYSKIMRWMPEQWDGVK